MNNVCMNIYSNFNTANPLLVLGLEMKCSCIFIFLVAIIAPKNECLTSYEVLGSYSDDFGEEEKSNQHKRYETDLNESGSN